MKVIRPMRIKWAGNIARLGRKRNAYRHLVGKPEGKRPLGRPRHRWNENIEIYIRETVYVGMGWIHIAQDRDQWRASVKTVMNLRGPLYSYVKFLSS
jgi:hypothetical protein